ncbi:formate--tetrahydrofolate ligase [Enterococcus sp. DIV0849a]|uniref:formate--tetrahydrofolate ligase n=1 Tax=Enterococcus sp. DIV0849a TaxID=2230879 RepID=UPI001F5DE5CC
MIGLIQEELKLFVKYKTKIYFSTIKHLSENEEGKWILVTSFNPTLVKSLKMIKRWDDFKSKKMLGHSSTSHIPASRNPNKRWEQKQLLWKYAEVHENLKSNFRECCLISRS